MYQTAMAMALAIKPGMAYDEGLENAIKGMAVMFGFTVLFR